jgi:hypothetical protein
VDEFRLQLVEPGLGLLALGQVANEAGEDAALADARFADRKLHREGAAVAAQAGDDPPDADDPPLSGRAVTVEIGIVALAVGRGHQHSDVLAEGL